MILLQLRLPVIPTPMTLITSKFHCQAHQNPSKTFSLENYLKHLAEIHSLSDKISITFLPIKSM